MTFDFTALAKMIEQNQLMIQFLYSIALERKVTIDDYNSVKPQNLSNDYAFDILAKCISDLEQNSQIEYYKVMLGSKDLTDSFFNDVQGFIKKFEDLTDVEIDETTSDGKMSEIEMKLIADGISLSNTMLSRSLSYIADLIQRLHASTFKKIIITLLRNGVDINRIIQTKANEKDKEYIKQKIKTELEKLPDGLQKEKVKNYLCKRFDIDPTELEA
jgi:hypothetical protein